MNNTYILVLDLRFNNLELSYCKILTTLDFCIKN